MYLKSKDPIFRPIDIYKVSESKLFSNLCIPSAIQSYSLCVEYMKDWFLSKFDKSYFKSIHLDGKHVFDDFKRFNRTEMLKRPKPALAIVPQLDNSFDRDKLDLSMFGLEMYLKRAKHKDTFFKDETNKVYLGLTMEAISMNFTFKIKVATRAQAVDALKYMKMAYRVGVTQGKDVDMEFHVPYKLIIQLAKDAGFRVVNNEIDDVVEFIQYLNKNSQLPFVYKLRCINGNNEFFIRVEGLYVHISTPDISSDDGEREGQLQTNFIIEMQSTVRFPCPKFYTYFTYKEYDELRFTEDDGATSSYLLNMTNVPSVNDKGWNQFMSTDYQEEILTKPLTIEFDGLMGNLGAVISHTKNMFLSPDLFIEIKLFNNFKEQNCKVDWDKMIITTDTIMKSAITHIAIYVDTEYVNTQIINMKEYKKNRLKQE